MKAQHLPTGNIFDLTGSCYFQEDDKLWIAVSYLDWKETKTNSFPVNDEGEIIHDDYILINE